MPLLPNETIDPWQALNPYKLWLLVILIAGLSLAGYIAARWLGSGRGTVITGLTGGLVSSTAVTLSFARRSRLENEPADSNMLACGILLAWTVMFGRVLVEVAVVNRALLYGLWSLAMALLPVTMLASLLARSDAWRTLLAVLPRVLGAWMVIAIFLNFFPPRAYLRWIRRRALAEQP